MRKAYMFTATILAAAALAVPALAADCMGNNARYAIDGADPGFSLVLTPRPEPLAWSDLDVVLNTPKQKYRFSLTASNGYSYNYAVQEEPVVSAEQTDAGSDDNLRIYFFDSDMNIQDLPQAGQPAPDAIFLPDFGGTLWYDTEPRQYLPIGMWRLQGCDP